MSGVAIITGASSGLGNQYVTTITENLTKIDEIWLIARRKERLEEIASRFPDKKFVVIPLDLNDYDSYDKFEDELIKRQPVIRVLINCAGFGKLGYVKDLDGVEQGNIVDLNCRALTVMSRLCIPYMRAKSIIINVSSIAAFIPTPRMTVYSASKAYVYAFSIGLRQELKELGINVLAVCPGPMDTEFLPVAGIYDNSKAFNTLPRCSVEAVVKNSLHAALAGEAVYVDKALYKAYQALAKILPHNWIIKFTTV